MKKFEVKKDHLKLLKASYVDWDEMEYGAPNIDPKRPYGTSLVEESIAEVLGWKLAEDSGGETFLNRKQQKLAIKLHKETQIVLQICLATQKFKPGIYVLKDEYNDHSWIKMDV